MEQWKEAPGLLAFEVSTLGQVRSKDRHGVWQIRSQNRASHGYLMVNVVRQDLARSSECVHSLVCRTFHGARPVGFDCCHNDGDRDNNSVANLRWDSRKNNISDQKLHGTFAWRGTRKLTIEQAVSAKAAVADGATLVSVARDLGVTHGAIGAICQGKVFRDEMDSTPLGRLKRRGNARRKLTKEKVMEIMARLRHGHMQESIAADFGVTRQNISDINTGHIWGWLTGKVSTRSVVGEE